MGIYRDTFIFFGFRARITPKLLRLFENKPGITITYVDQSSALVYLTDKTNVVQGHIDLYRRDGIFHREDLGIDPSFFGVSEDSIKLFESVKCQWIIADIESCSLDSFATPATLHQIHPLL